MGSTVRGLSSLFNTAEEFEMYIVDNDSRDLTWDYIESLKDPRIVGKKKFERNFGAINSINWTLTHRKKGQDFINVESDVFNLTSNFVQMFRRVSDEFGPALIQACFAMGAKKHYRIIEWSNGVFFAPLGYLKGPPMSFCYMPSFALDRLGFLCEATCLMDTEFTSRIIKGLHKKVGVSPSIQCIHIEDKQVASGDGLAYTCKVCQKYQDICKGVNSQCATFYPGIEGVELKGYPAWGRHNRAQRDEIIQKRLRGELPLRCSTYHLGNLEPWEEQMRKDNMEFLADYYEKYIKIVTGDTNSDEA